MKRCPRILYCHCAYADTLRPDVKDPVLAALSESGAAYEAVPDLCELAARRDPLLKSFAEGDPRLVIACHPRAVRWLFAAAGAPLSAEGVEFLNMRTQSAEEILSHLPRQTRGRAARKHKPPQFPAKQPGAWAPWFPVIDYDRCRNCGQCLQFCLFGVYAMDGKKIRVVQPDHCKTGCPACARICPSAAILFPKYVSGAISGDDSPASEADRPAQPIDFSSLAGLDLHEAMRRRGEILKARGEARHG